MFTLMTVAAFESPSWLELKAAPWDGFSPGSSLQPLSLSSSALLYSSSLSSPLSESSLLVEARPVSSNSSSSTSSTLLLSSSLLLSRLLLPLLSFSSTSLSRSESVPLSCSDSSSQSDVSSVCSKTPFLSTTLSRYSSPLVPEKPFPERPLSEKPCSRSALSGSQIISKRR